MGNSDLFSGLALEKRKLDEDVRLRARELNIREAEIKRSKWANPLVLAVMAAALAGFSNAVVTWMSGANQIELEKSKYSQENAIEEAKAESARILELVKTNDPDKAAQNIQFLLDSGLISTPERREKLKSYLFDRKGGQGVGTTSFIDVKPDGSKLPASIPKKETKKP